MTQPRPRFAPEFSTDELSRENTWISATAGQKRARADTTTTLPPNSQILERKGKDLRTSDHNISRFSTTSDPLGSSPPHIDSFQSEEEEDELDLEELDTMIREQGTGSRVGMKGKQDTEDMDKDDEEEDYSNREMLVHINSLLMKQTKRQERRIRDLEKRIDHLTTLVTQIGNTQTPSSNTRKWSQVAGGVGSQNIDIGKPKRNEETTTPKPISKAQRRFIILRESEGSSEFEPVRIRDAINNALTRDKAPPTLKVAEVSLNPRGNIVILTRDNCTAEGVMKHKEAIEKAVKETDTKAKAIQSTEHWHKLLVHGIDIHSFPDGDEGMGRLRDEIETYNPSIQLMNNPRYLTRPEKRRDKSRSSVVIAIQCKESAETAEQRGILVHGTKRKTAKFIATRPFDQCTRCQHFGHSWQRCKGEERCRLCAGAHATNQHECRICETRGNLKGCQHTLLRCCNCRAAHRASDPNCPQIKELHAKYNVRPTGESIIASQ
jgi:hypothetical protein